MSGKDARSALRIDDKYRRPSNNTIRINNAKTDQLTFRVLDQVSIPIVDVDKARAQAQHIRAARERIGNKAIRRRTAMMGKMQQLMQKTQTAEGELTRTQRRINSSNNFDKAALAGRKYSRTHRGQQLVQDLSVRALNAQRMAYNEVIMRDVKRVRQRTNKTGWMDRVFKSTTKKEMERLRNAKEGEVLELDLDALTSAAKGGAASFLKMSQKNAKRNMVLSKLFTPEGLKHATVQGLRLVRTSGLGDMAGTYAMASFGVPMGTMAQLMGGIAFGTAGTGIVAALAAIGIAATVRGGLIVFETAVSLDWSSIMTKAKERLNAYIANKETSRALSDVEREELGKTKSFMEKLSTGPVDALQNALVHGGLVGKVFMEEMMKSTVGKLLARDVVMAGQGVMNRVAANVLVGTLDIGMHAAGLGSVVSAAKLIDSGTGGLMNAAFRGAVTESVKAGLANVSLVPESVREGAWEAAPEWGKNAWKWAQSVTEDTGEGKGAMQEGLGIFGDVNKAMSTQRAAQMRVGAALERRQVASQMSIDDQMELERANRILNGVSDRRYYDWQSTKKSLLHTSNWRTLYEDAKDAATSTMGVAGMAMALVGILASSGQGIEALPEAIKKFPYLSGAASWVTGAVKAAAISMWSSETVREFAKSSMQRCIAQTLPIDALADAAIDKLSHSKYSRTLHRRQQGHLRAKDGKLVDVSSLPQRMWHNTIDLWYDYVMPGMIRGMSMHMSYGIADGIMAVGHGVIEGHTSTAADMKKIREGMQALAMKKGGADSPEFLRMLGQGVANWDFEDVASVSARMGESAFIMAKAPVRYLGSFVGAGGPMSEAPAQTPDFFAEKLSMLPTDELRELAKQRAEQMKGDGPITAELLGSAAQSVFQEAAARFGARDIGSMSVPRVGVPAAYADMGSEQAEHEMLKFAFGGLPSDIYHASATQLDLLEDRLGTLVNSGLAGPRIVQMFRNIDGIKAVAREKAAGATDKTAGWLMTEDEKDKMGQFAELMVQDGIMSTAQMEAMRKDMESRPYDWDMISPQYERVRRYFSTWYADINRQRASSTTNQWWGMQYLTEEEKAQLQNWATYLHTDVSMWTFQSPEATVGVAQKNLRDNVDYFNALSTKLAVLQDQVQRVATDAFAGAETAAELKAELEQLKVQHKELAVVIKVQKAANEMAQASMQSMHSGVPFSVPYVDPKWAKVIEEFNRTGTLNIPDDLSLDGEGIPVFESRTMEAQSMSKWTKFWANYAPVFQLDTKSSDWGFQQSWYGGKKSVQSLLGSIDDKVAAAATHHSTELMDELRRRIEQSTEENAADATLTREEIGAVVGAAIREGASINEALRDYVAAKNKGTSEAYRASLMEDLIQVTITVQQIETLQSMMGGLDSTGSALTETMEDLVVTYKMLLHKLDQTGTLDSRMQDLMGAKSDGEYETMYKAIVRDFVHTGQTIGATIDVGTAEELVDQGSVIQQLADKVRGDASDIDFTVQGHYQSFMNDAWEKFQERHPTIDLDAVEEGDKPLIARFVQTQTRAFNEQLKDPDSPVFALWSKYIDTMQQGSGIDSITRQQLSDYVGSSWAPFYAIDMDVAQKEAEERVKITVETTDTSVIDLMNGISANKATLQQLLDSPFMEEGRMAKLKHDMNEIGAALEGAQTILQDVLENPAKYHFQSMDKDGPLFETALHDALGANWRMLLPFQTADFTVQVTLGSGEVRQLDRAGLIKRMGQTRDYTKLLTKLRKTQGLEATIADYNTLVEKIEEEALAQNRIASETFVHTVNDVQQKTMDQFGQLVDRAGAYMAREEGSGPIESPSAIIKDAAASLIGSSSLVSQLEGVEGQLLNSVRRFFVQGSLQGLEGESLQNFVADQVMARGTLQQLDLSAISTPQLEELRRTAKEGRTAQIKADAQNRVNILETELSQVVSGLLDTYVRTGLYTSVMADVFGPEPSEEAARIGLRIFQHSASSVSAKTAFESILTSEALSEEDRERILSAGKHLDGPIISTTELADFASKLGVAMEAEDTTLYDVIQRYKMHNPDVDAAAVKANVNKALKDTFTNESMYDWAMGSVADASAEMMRRLVPHQMLRTAGSLAGQLAHQYIRHTLLQRSMDLFEDQLRTMFYSLDQETEEEVEDVDERRAGQEGEGKRGAGPDLNRLASFFVGDIVDGIDLSQMVSPDTNTSKHFLDALNRMHKVDMQQHDRMDQIAEDVIREHSREEATVQHSLQEEEDMHKKSVEQIADDMESERARVMAQLQSIDKELNDADTPHNRKLELRVRKGVLQKLTASDIERNAAERLAKHNARFEESRLLGKEYQDALGKRTHALTEKRQKLARTQAQLEAAEASGDRREETRWRKQLLLDKQSLAHAMMHQNLLVQSKKSAWEASRRRNANLDAQSSNPMLNEVYYDLAADVLEAELGSMEDPEIVGQVNKAVANSDAMLDDMQELAAQFEKKRAAMMEEEEALHTEEGRAAGEVTSQLVGYIAMRRQKLGMWADGAEGEIATILAQMKEVNADLKGQEVQIADLHKQLRVALIHNERTASTSKHAELNRARINHLKMALEAAEQEFAATQTRLTEFMKDAEHVAELFDTSLDDVHTQFEEGQKQAQKHIMSDLDKIFDEQLEELKLQNTQNIADIRKKYDVVFADLQEKHTTAMRELDHDPKRLQLHQDEYERQVAYLRDALTRAISAETEAQKERIKQKEAIYLAQRNIASEIFSVSMDTERIEELQAAVSKYQNIMAAFDNQAMQAAQMISHQISAANLYGHGTYLGYASVSRANLIEIEERREAVKELHQSNLEAIEKRFNDALYSVEQKYREEKAAFLEVGTDESAIDALNAAMHKDTVNLTRLRDEAVSVERNANKWRAAAIDNVGAVAGRERANRDAERAMQNIRSGVTAKVTHFYMGDPSQVQSISVPKPTQPTPEARWTGAGQVLHHENLVVNEVEEVEAATQANMQKVVQILSDEGRDVSEDEVGHTLELLATAGSDFRAAVLGIKTITDQENARLRELEAENQELAKPVLEELRRLRHEGWAAHNKVESTKDAFYADPTNQAMRSAYLSALQDNQKAFDLYQAQKAVATQFVRELNERYSTEKQRAEEVIAAAKETSSTAIDDIVARLREDKAELEADVQTQQNTLKRKWEEAKEEAVKRAKRAERRVQNRALLRKQAADLRARVGTMEEIGVDEEVARQEAMFSEGMRRFMDEQTREAREMTEEQKRVIAQYDARVEDAKALKRNTGIIFSESEEDYEKRKADAIAAAESERAKKLDELKAAFDAHQTLMQDEREKYETNMRIARQRQERMKQQTRKQVVQEEIRRIDATLHDVHVLTKEKTELDKEIVVGALLASGMPELEGLSTKDATAYLNSMSEADLMRNYLSIQTDTLTVAELETLWSSQSADMLRESQSIMERDGTTTRDMELIQGQLLDEIMFKDTGIAPHIVRDVHGKPVLNTDGTYKVRYTPDDITIPFSLQQKWETEMGVQLKDMRSKVASSLYGKRTETETRNMIHHLQQTYNLSEEVAREVLSVNPNTTKLTKVAKKGLDAIVKEVYTKFGEAGVKSLSPSAFDANGVGVQSIGQMTKNVMDTINMASIAVDLAGKGAGVVGSAAAKAKDMGSMAWEAGTLSGKVQNLRSAATSHMAGLNRSLGTIGEALKSGRLFDSLDDLKAVAFNGVKTSSIDFNYVKVGGKFRFAQKVAQHSNTARIGAVLSSTLTSSMQAGRDLFKEMISKTTVRNLLSQSNQYVSGIQGARVASSMLHTLGFTEDDMLDVDVGSVVNDLMKADKDSVQYKVAHKISLLMRLAREQASGVPMEGTRVARMSDEDLANASADDLQSLVGEVTARRREMAQVSGKITNAADYSDLFGLELEGESDLGYSISAGMEILSEYLGGFNYNVIDMLHDVMAMTPPTGEAVGDFMGSMRTVLKSTSEDEKAESMSGLSGVVTRLGRTAFATGQGVYATGKITAQGATHMGMQRAFWRAAMGDTGAIVYNTVIASARVAADAGSDLNDLMDRTVNMLSESGGEISGDLSKEIQDRVRRSMLQKVKDPLDYTAEQVEVQADEWINQVSMEELEELSERVMQFTDREDVLDMVQSMRELDAAQAVLLSVVTDTDVDEEALSAARARVNTAKAAVNEFKMTLWSLSKAVSRFDSAAEWSPAIRSVVGKYMDDILDGKEGDWASITSSMQEEGYFAKNGVFTSKSQIGDSYFEQTIKSYSDSFIQGMKIITDMFGSGSEGEGGGGEGGGGE